MSIEKNLFYLKRIEDNLMLEFLDSENLLEHVE